MKNLSLPLDYLFETGWEVCNKVGGIHTVLSSKAPYAARHFEARHIFIGPDVWREKTNQEFIEDREAYPAWHEQAERDGLHFRIGHWNIENRPLVFLIDYTSFFPKKDDIFKELWENYKLDSISGQWDYMEPAIFGYVAGKLIEHFYQYNVMPNERVLAHFHEWMTGAGVLYLKKNNPYIATAYTSHSTVLGRTIAENGLPLYTGLHSYHADQLSNSYHIRAKFSLERLAAQSADVFTTTSELSNKQCLQFLGKAADKITENGMGSLDGQALLVDPQRKSTARQKMLCVASGLLNQEMPADTFLVLGSGRYEFRNKGIDAYIDALGLLNQATDLKRPVLAFLFIPASHNGSRHEVLERMSHPDYDHPIVNDFCTHYLNHPSEDLILRRLLEKGLHNHPDDKVKVVFAPCYLNGQDGIFDLPYYDLLSGFDASIFPSYYEPWGYTPMESIAYQVPTLTTTLSGFGQWINKRFPGVYKGLSVLERNDENYTQSIEHICEWLYDLNLCGSDFGTDFEKLAAEITQQASWEEQIKHYATAYEMALEKVEVRSESHTHVPLPFNYGIESSLKRVKPEWKKVLINPFIPEKLKKLHELSMNLWWSWDTEATALFASIHPALWETLERNPVALLQQLNSTSLSELENRVEFMENLDHIYRRFRAYMDEKNPNQIPKVAYFSMEFGLHESVKIYSGGLGILAGDYLKEASDSNYNMIGMGLLYRYGYFKQQISLRGEQIAHSIPQKFTQLPLQAVRNSDGEWVEISISLPGRLLHAKVWRLDVGRVPLFLLDTDIEKNNESDRSITHHLYGGDIEHRLKQEILLGVGGVRAIRKMHQKPDLFHCNEGHAAFIGLERLKVMIEEEGKSFVHAKELVRATTLFTTHTPVPAGHDAFSEDLMRTYIAHYPKRLGITWQDLIGLGRVYEEDPNEKFSMSILAAKLSQEMNGVSKIHGRVSREMFASMFNGYYANELYIGHVTNGVHYGTWTHPLWKDLHKKHFGESYLQDMSNPEYWKGIEKASDEEIWNIRKTLLKRLIDLSKEKLMEDMTTREENPNTILKMLEGISEHKLTIGFARRFATYKRAHLLFSNPQRLSEIVNNPKRPVQFIFAGKAHPADKAGQDLIQLILNYSKQPEFIGKIFFLENYDIEIAKHLVQGVDIWMNTPTRPLEASGTSGEKAIMNGVLNLSVLDGWWAEGYKEQAGWALKEKQTYDNNAFQDALDAETIYNLIENEITEAYYAQDERGVSKKWIELIKKNFTDISPHFTMKRQLDDYIRQYYSPLYERSSILIERGGRKAHELALWKVKVAQAWDRLEVVHTEYHNSTQNPLRLGDIFHTEIVLDLKELSPDDIGIEMVFAQKVNDHVDELMGHHALQLIRCEGSIATYQLDIETKVTGVYDFAFRIFPTHPLLPHRQDFNLIKWA